MKLKTPELDKMHAAKDKSQIIGEFLDLFLMQEKQLSLCKYERHSERYVPVYTGVEALLAEYFKINLNKVEKERRAILNALREGETKGKQ